MRRHRHDRPGAIPGQNIVGCPDRHLLSVGRIDRVRPGEHTALVLGQVGALEVAFPGRLGLIHLDCGLVLDGNNLPEQSALWRHDHVGRAEQRVRPSGEDGNLEVGILDAEKHLSTLRASDPVALHFLERVAPVDAVKIVEQALRVSGDAQHPLAHRLAHHRETTDLAHAILDLLVGQDGAEFRTPVHRRFTHIGQAMVVPPGTALLTSGHVGRIGQRVDRFRPVFRRVEP